MSLQHQIPTRRPSTPLPRVRARTFGDLTIQYDDRVLAPREWTVAQSQWAADISDALPPGSLLELCTGAGQIGLLAAHLSGRAAVLVDRDPVACFYARANVAAAGLADRVEVRQDIFDLALLPGEHFPLVLADPPWVPSAHTDDFPADPVGAIDGGPDGLSLARASLELAAAAMQPDGATILQVGNSEQVAALEAWLATPAAPDLTIADVRVHPRGVLVLLRRTESAR